MIRAVLFDAVDTLIRPWPSVGALYARAAAAAGVRCGARALGEHFPRAYRDLYPRRFSGASGLRTSERRERGWWKQVVALTLRRAGAPAPRPEQLDAALEVFAHGAAWRPTPGALETLRALRGLGLELGLVSNFDARLRPVLADLGMAPLLSVVAISSEVGWAKPSPRIYREALRRLGVAPGEALMVGDRAREDLGGATAAGMRALLYAPRGGGRGPERLRDLRRLPGRLGSLPPPRSP